MSDHLTPMLILLRSISAVLATVLVVLAVRAWRRSGDDRMARLAAGFALLLFSLAVEALSFQVLFPNDLLTAHVIEAGAQLVGFAVLIWALF